MRIYGEIEKAIAGQSYGLDEQCESFCAGEDMYPGDPAFGIVGDEKMAYGAHLSAVTLTADADLITGNSVVVTINGVELDAVVFDESSAKTIASIVTAINLSEGVRAFGITASAVTGAARAFSLVGPGVTIEATAVVTGGTSQAEFTSAANNTMKFIGVVRHEHIVEGINVGVFKERSAIPVQTFGKIYVRVANSATPQDKKAAYVILSGADAGKFTDASIGNYDCGCFFRSGVIETDLALIELRGMK